MRLTAHQGNVYFFVNEVQHGAELWTSDGTTAGTKMVRDINPGPAGSIGSPLIVPIGERVAFVANDGVHGDELWLSDGTEQGTTMVGDIRPGPDGSDPHAIANINGKLYFAANDGVHDAEPWTLVDDGQRPLFGDSNHDGNFNSRDLIFVLQRGEFEDGIAGNSTFDDGDWNGDREFDTKDLIEAFQAGTYVMGSVATWDAAMEDIVSEIDLGQNRKKSTRRFEEPIAFLNEDKSVQIDISDLK